jgi:hypothetical protein
MKASKHHQSANNKYQETFRENLDNLGLCRITAIVPKEYKKSIDMHAVMSGKKKKDVLTEVIKIGIDNLGIS